MSFASRARMLILLCLMVPLVTLSQTQVAVYTGTNLTYVMGAKMGDVNSGDLRDYWFPAINLGGAIQFSITDWFDLSPGLEYNLCLFDSFNQQTIAVPGGVTRSSGHPSHIFRLTVDARFVDHPLGQTRVYALIGLGYVARNVGSIDLTLASPYTQAQLTFEPTREWVQTFGLGVQLPLSRSYSLDAGIKCFADYRDPIDLSMTVGITYRLSELGLAP